WNYFLYKKVIFNPGSITRSFNMLKTGSRNVWTNHKKQLLFFVLLSLPIVVFFYQYVATGNKTFGGDFDYYSQQYEAFRISVLKYHQFPLWNPWLSGGVPLFANPQFGLFSLQAILVLIFGAIYGLKLAYIGYGIIGFWGMYLLGRSVFSASKLRSILIAYIWVFCGFFAGHGVWHITFTSFYFLPWFIYFLSQRQRKYSWLGLGVTMSLVILSSIHYAFLMITLTLAIYFFLSIINLQISRKSILFNFELTRQDVLFIAKAVATTIVLAGYQFYSTYHFESHNQRLTDQFIEPPNSLGLLVKAMFFPIGTLIKHYPKTTWFWGEYSMYIGMATGIALLVCLCTLIYDLFKKRKINYIYSARIIIIILIIGLFGALLAIGDKGNLSPFHLLHNLPGFTQTRVPSRWLIMTVFAVLLFLLAWRRNPKIINALLVISVVELFLSHGPPRIMGKNTISIPAAKFSSNFMQYDNGKDHTDMSDPNKLYYYTTSKNVGQVYADDSLINTLSGFAPLPTSRCAYNTSKNCSFVMSHNAKVTYWSPNKIILHRTGNGPIELDMNVESGWRVNGQYIFAGDTSLQPAIRFLIPNNAADYTLEYAPRLSPSWISWKLANFTN
ncbi:MAG: hypothetical protein ACXWLH_05640, partial [Candidatus Saccharimonadales bacterium]